MSKIQKQILRNLNEKIQNTSNVLDKVPIINLTHNDVTFNKDKNRIILLENYNVANRFDSNPIIITYSFSKLSDWALAHLYVWHEIYTKSSFEIDDDLQFTSYYYFRYVDGDYILYNIFYSDFSPAEQIYLNVYLTIYNQNIYHEIQHNKK